MARNDYVTLDGYTVTIATVKAVGVCKDAIGGDPVFIPRSLCQDGDSLDRGDQDIAVQLWKAEDLGLDY